MSFSFVEDEEVWVVKKGYEAERGMMLQGGAYEDDDVVSVLEQSSMHKNGVVHVRAKDIRHTRVDALSLARELLSDREHVLAGELKKLGLRDCELRALLVAACEAAK